MRSLVMTTALAAGLLSGSAFSFAATAAPAPVARSSGAASAGEEDIRDIHGPIAAPRRSPAWWVVAAGVVVVAAAMVARRRHPRLGPDQRALRALAGTRTLLNAGDTWGFSIAVSAIVRVYVGEAFGIRAPHRTTEELLGDLMTDTSPLAAHRPMLGEFLGYCDLAKFAGWALSPQQMEAMLNSAEAFIVATARPSEADRSGAPRSTPPSRLVGSTAEEKTA